MAEDTSGDEYVDLDRDAFFSADGIRITQADADELVAEIRARARRQDRIDQAAADIEAQLDALEPGSTPLEKILRPGDPGWRSFEVGP